jgi:hypothetical protein
MRPLRPRNLITSKKWNDVGAYLEQLWKDIVDIRGADDELKEGQLEPSARAQTIERRVAALKRLGKFPSAST